MRRKKRDKNPIILKLNISDPIVVLTLRRIPSIFPLKELTVVHDTASAGNAFQILTTLWLKEFLVSILQTAHLWANTGVVFRELSSRLEYMESTTGYTFTPCVGSFTSPGIDIR